MKKIAIILSEMLFAIQLHGQDYLDALRFSQTFLGGTARYNAMSGAFGAVGGDFSTLSSNPAGLGIYRGSEFIFSPALSTNVATSKFYGTTMEDFTYTFNIGNIGFVGTSMNAREVGVVSTSYAFGYNRLADFNQSVIIEGINTESSLSDYFLHNAHGYHPDDLDDYYERLAYDAYVIDIWDTNINSYIANISVPEKQRKVINTGGHIGEWVFSMATNIENKFFLGGTLGIQSLRYLQKNTHTEFSLFDDDPIQQFSFREELFVRGTGFNFKAGIIAQPVSMLRLGAALHLPTFYRIKEDYYTTMQSGGLYGDIEQKPTDYNGYRLPHINNSYSLNGPTSMKTLPLKASGSAALIMEKRAVVSVEYEYVDYSTMRLRDGKQYDEFVDKNATIKNTFHATGNLKTGMEIKYENLAIRFGYALFGSPYRSRQKNAKAATNFYSGGIGYRQGNVSFDLAYIVKDYSINYKLYDVWGYTEPWAKITSSTGDIVASVGFRF